MLRKVVGIYLIWRFLLLLGIILGVYFIPQLLDVSSKAYVSMNLPYLAWIHANSDGTLYTYIARNGYHPEEPGFFPLLPIFIRVFHDLFSIDRFLYSGLIVVNLVFLLCIFSLYRLFLLDQKSEKFIFFFLIILIYPTSIFYTAVYNDGLFLLFATLSLFFSRQERWVLASICAAFATLARLNGLALGVYLVVEFAIAEGILDTKMFKLKLNNVKKSGGNLAAIGNIMRDIIKKNFYAVLLIPAAYVGYLYYLNVNLGDWRILFSSMSKWQQSQITFPLQVFYRYLKILFTSPNFTALNYYVAFLEFGFVCFYLFMIYYSYKKIRFSYWVFMVVSFLIPSLTGTFQGMPRYSLHLYPFFLSIYLLMANRSIKFKTIYFAICFILLLFYTAFFTRGYFVA